MFHYLKLFLAGIIAAAFITFAISNRAAVSLSLFPLPYSIELPLFLLAAASFALGILACGIALQARMFKHSRLYHAEKKRVMALENELEGLRSEQLQAAMPSSSLTLAK